MSHSRKLLCLLAMPFAILLATLTTAYSVPETGQGDSIETLYDAAQEQLSACVETGDTAACSRVLELADTIDAINVDTPFLWELALENDTIRRAEPGPDGLLLVAGEKGFYEVDENTGEIVAAYNAGESIDEFYVPQPYEGIVIERRDELEPGVCGTGGVCACEASGERKYVIDAIEIKTGRVLWEQEYSERLDLTLHNGSVYMRDENSYDEPEKEKKLSCIDIETGKNVWEFEAAGSIEELAFGTQGTVFVKSDVLEEYKYNAEERDERDWIYSIDAATGEVRWSKPFFDIGYSSLAIAGHGVIVDTAGDLVSLDEFTGEVKWGIPGELYYFGVINETLYYENRESEEVSYVTFYAIDPETGIAKWSTEIPVVRSGWRIMESDTRLYIAGGRDFDTNLASLHAIDKETGELRLTISVDDRFFLMPEVVDGKAYVMDVENKVHAIDDLSGEIIWEREFIRSNYSPAFLTAGEVVVFLDASLAILDRETGQALLNKRIPGISSSVTSGDLFFFEGGNRVYALRMDSLYRGPFAADLDILRARAYTAMGDANRARGILDHLENDSLNLRDVWLAKIEACRSIPDVPCAVGAALRFIYNYPEDPEAERLHQFVINETPIKWVLGSPGSGPIDWRPSNAFYFIAPNTISVIACGKRCLTSHNYSTLLNFDDETGNVKWVREDINNHFLRGSVFNGEIFFENDNRVFAIDELTGETNWEFSPEEDEYVDSLRVYDGELFVIVDDRIIAFAAASKEPKWSFEINGLDSGLWISGIDDERIYLDTTPEPPQDDDEIKSLLFRPPGRIHALDRAAGNVEWTVSDLPPIGSSNVFMISGKIFVTKRMDDEECMRRAVGCDEEQSECMELLWANEDILSECRSVMVSAFDKATGRKVWENEYGIDYYLFRHGLSEGPTPEDVLVYSSNKNKIMSIHADTGAKKWMADIENPGVREEAVVFQDSIYAYASGTLQAFDINNGTRLFKTELDYSHFLSDGPKVAGDRLVATTYEHVYSIDRKSGDVLWTYDIMGEAWDLPIVQDGVVYFPDEHNLAAMDINTGTEIWSMSSEDVFFENLVYADNTLYALVCIYLAGCNVLAIDTQKAKQMSAEGQHWWADEVAPAGD